jgi:WD40 repeat protein
MHLARWIVVLSCLTSIVLPNGAAHAQGAADPLVAAALGTRLAPAGTIALPGRGLALAWSPDGGALAAGGHFKDHETGQRYDTRLIDVPGRRLLAKSFDCHGWWVVSLAWTLNPFVGEVIADGGGDHAVKVWSVAGPGSTTCHPGQFRSGDGGLKALYQINGWVTSLAFSPDGRFLATASRDRAIRIWQVEPGPDQWKVVRLWWDVDAGNFLSVRWSPDGQRVLTGDRRGRVAEWRFDPTLDRWDADTTARFARVGWSQQPWWYKHNPAAVGRTPLWSDGGHKQVWNARYSPDGARVVAGGGDGVLSVFAAGTGALVYRTTPPKPTPLLGLDWSPDGALIAAGGADQRLYVFAAADGTLLSRLDGHREDVTAVAWAPDGRTLASTAGGPLLNLQLNPIVTGPDDAVHLWSRN